MRLSPCMLAISATLFVQTSACKKKDDHFVAPQDLRTDTSLSQDQKKAVAKARLFPSSSCLGKGLALQPDPDLTYADCFYYERKNYHLKEYRDLYASTPEDRKRNCKLHRPYTFDSPPPIPPEMQPFVETAIRAICTVSPGEGQEVFEP